MSFTQVTSRAGFLYHVDDAVIPRCDATVSELRQLMVSCRQISSTIAGVPGRPISILLPRGYDQNPAKRYPVVYFHDGQNVFFPGGPFGVWNADRISRYETSQGRMREAILVSIPNGNDYGSNRLREYLPTGETIRYAGTTYTGNATAFMDFLLANVLPTLDVNYRTLTGPANTMTFGSFMGGLFSDHLAFTHPNRFGAAGIISPAYWAAPLWVAQRDAAAQLPLRRYLYMGTAESGTGEGSSHICWRGALQAHDAWLKAGHSVNGDLRFEGGFNAQDLPAGNPAARQGCKKVTILIFPKDDGYKLLLHSTPEAHCGCCSLKPKEF